MHITGRDSDIGRSPNSVTDNHGCITTGDATTSSVTSIMVSVTRNTAGIVAGMSLSLGKLDPLKVESRAAASILQLFYFVIVQ